MSPVVDPLGLKRCAVCSNAFEFDADPRATSRAVELGLIEPEDFICRHCARREAVGQALAEAERVRRETGR